MAACKNCGVILYQDHRLPRRGLCPGCGSEVCFVCGCTEAKPCVTPTADGGLACAWAPEYGPGVCNSCVFKQAEHAYREATREP